MNSPTNSKKYDQIDIFIKKFKPYVKPGPGPGLSPGKSILETLARPSQILSPDRSVVAVCVCLKGP